MPDDEVTTSPHETRRRQARPHPVRRAVVVAVAALALLAWSATLEVACALGGLAPADPVNVVVPPCPSQSVRTSAAAVGAGVVLLGLGVLLILRRRRWVRPARAERALFVAFGVVTVVAVLRAFGATGFVAAI